MVLCERVTRVPLQSRPGPRARRTAGGGRTRGYCWSKITEWSGAGGGSFGKKGPLWISAGAVGPVPLLERGGVSERFPRLFRLIHGFLGAGAGWGGVYGEPSPTDATRIRDPQPPCGLAVALSTEVSQAPRAAEPRSSELTGRGGAPGWKAEWPRQLLCCQGSGRLRARNSGWKWMWTPSASTFHRLWVGAEVGLQEVQTRLPIQCLRLEMGACVCVCVRTQVCARVWRNCSLRCER